MALGPNHGNPFIEGHYPCTDPEITDVNCEDCPIYPACAREINREIPQDRVPFPGANLGKNFNLVAGRVLLNLGIINLKPERTNQRTIQNGSNNTQISNQQFLGF